MEALAAGRHAGLAGLTVAFFADLGACLAPAAGIAREKRTEEEAKLGALAMRGAAEWPRGCRGKP